MAASIPTPRRCRNHTSCRWRGCLVYARALTFSAMISPAGMAGTENEPRPSYECSTGLAAPPAATSSRMLGLS